MYPKRGFIVLFISYRLSKSGWQPGTREGQSETMETPTITGAPKRARLSLLFGLTWLFLGLTWLILVISYGSLEGMIPRPLSPVGVTITKLIPVIERWGYNFWVGSGLLCIITAFPEPKNPRSWQGTTAVFLAVLAILFVIIPALCRMVGFS